jgi:hypothetical protein
MPRAHPRGVFFLHCHPGFIPGSPYAISLAAQDHHLVDGVKILSLLLKF